MLIEGKSLDQAAAQLGWPVAQLHDLSEEYQRQYGINKSKFRKLQRAYIASQTAALASQALKLRQKKERRDSVAIWGEASARIMERQWLDRQLDARAFQDWCAALRLSDLSVKEIALACGYSERQVNYSLKCFISRATKISSHTSRPLRLSLLNGGCAYLRLDIREHNLRNATAVQRVTTFRNDQRGTWIADTPQSVEQETINSYGCWSAPTDYIILSGREAVEATVGKIELTDEDSEWLNDYQVAFLI